MSSDHSSSVIPEPYMRLMHNINRHVDLYRQWRTGFAKHAQAFAAALGKEYNSRLEMGRFRAIPLDVDFLVKALAAPPAPSNPAAFNPVAFNRYAGSGVATFYTYRIDNGQETGLPSNLYSFWEPDVYRHGDWHAKRISGSHRGYFHPRAIMDTSSTGVDLTLNTFRHDIGVISWVEMFQHGRGQRTAVAYKMPGPHEILWFVKQVPVDDPDTAWSEFLVSHEWKETTPEGAVYPMVIIFLSFNFKTGEIRYARDTMLRALYHEAPFPDFKPPTTLSPT